MKALVYVGDARVRQLDVPPPQSRAGEVMITVLQAGILAVIWARGDDVSRAFAIIAAFVGSALISAWPPCRMA